MIPVCVYTFEVPDVEFTGKYAKQKIYDFLRSDHGEFVLRNSIKELTIAQLTGTGNNFLFQVYAYLNDKSYVYWELKYK